MNKGDELSNTYFERLAEKGADRDGTGWRRVKDSLQGNFFGRQDPEKEF